MDIFVVIDNRVGVTPQALNIKAFKDIWFSNKDKGISIAELSYVEFMCSYLKTNPFVGYLDLEERSIKILENLDIEVDPTSDKIISAMEIYRELQIQGSPSIRVYEAALNTTARIVTFMNTVDLNAVNAKGYLLYKPADIIRTVTEAENIIKTLAALKIKVYSESYEASRGKAGREINYFEQPDKLKT